MDTYNFDKFLFWVGFITFFLLSFGLGLKSNHFLIQEQFKDCSAGNRVQCIEAIDDMAEDDPLRLRMKAEYKKKTGKDLTY